MGCVYEKKGSKRFWIVLFFSIILTFGVQGRCKVHAADAAVAAVSAGFKTTAIVTTDGTLYVCGSFHDENYGEYLIKDEQVDYPVQVMSGVRYARAGYGYIAILKTDGTLWMCGLNQYGQFGDGTKTFHSTPVQVMSGVMDVSTGENHIAILKTDGTLWMCGENEDGQLGDGTDTDRFTPVQIMSGVKSVSVGLYDTAILKTDGTLWMCGYNSHGQFGDGTNEPRSIPVQVMSGVKSVSVGSSHTAILKTDGTLWMCGFNGYGQLGDGTDTIRFTPVPIMSGVKDVSAGSYHTAILKTDGTLWMCGNNDNGQLGDGTDTARFTPIKIMSGVKSVNAGYLHTGILKTDGTLWMCGYGSDGQLGGGEVIEKEGYSPTPVQITLGKADGTQTATSTTTSTAPTSTTSTTTNTGTTPTTSTTTNSTSKTTTSTKSDSTPKTKSYKVTFNPNGGKIAKGSKKTMTVTNGKAYGTLPKATRKGYVFLGWYTKKKGGSVIKKTTKALLSKNTTIYAQWSKPVSIKKATIKVSSCTYNGSAQKPNITVTYKKKKLKEGTDYKVSYKNNKNATKKAVVIIKGKGLYKDAAVKNFTINPLSLTNSKVSISLKQKVISESKKNSIPPFTASITVGKKKISLKKGTDFTVSISVNLKSRKGEVVFKGKGNFGGSKKIKISVSGKGTNNTSNNTSDWKTRMYKFIQLDAYKNKASWPAAKKPLISSYGCKGCRAYAADFVAYVYGKRNSKKDPVINKYKDYTDKSCNGGRKYNITDIQAGDLVVDNNGKHIFAVIEINWITGEMYTAEGNVNPTGTEEGKKKATARVGKNIYRVVNDGNKWHLEEKKKKKWERKKFDFTRHYGNVD